jgi:hypothetical protein
MINVKLDEEKLLIFLDKLTPEILDALTRELTQQSKMLEGHIITRHLTGGTTDDRLSVQSGHLRRTTRALIAKRKGSTITAGVGFGAKYAGVHVGPKGKKTVIRPKRAKNLAIPLPAARTRAGAGRTISPRDFPNLIFIPGKNTPSGSSLLVQKRGKQIVPMFVLKKMVTISTRVHLKSIIARKKAEIVQGISDALNKVINKTT